MPFLPAPLSVTATTIATWPFLPLVMNCFTPLITYSSPCLTAVVRSDEASEPTCGSVRQNAPSISPRASGSSHCFFCAALPYFIRMALTGQLVTLITVLVPPSPAAISSSTKASER